MSAPVRRHRLDAETRGHVLSAAHNTVLREWELYRAPVGGGMSAPELTACRVTAWIEFRAERDPSRLPMPGHSHVQRVRAVRTALEALVRSGELVRVRGTGSRGFGAVCYEPAPKGDSQ